MAHFLKALLLLEANVKVGANRILKKVALIHALKPSLISHKFILSPHTNNFMVLISQFMRN
ncbi:hypothetical protein V6Z12_D08G173900 [Gossypium hirsutum]